MKAFCSHLRKKQIEIILSPCSSFLLTTVHRAVTHDIWIFEHLEVIKALCKNVCIIFECGFDSLFSHNAIRATEMIYAGRAKKKVCLVIQRYSIRHNNFYVVNTTLIS